MSDPSTFADFKLQEKEAKKKIILQAAIRVFSEKSLHKASLREIAEEAGISHANIYRYFQDKQSLFVEAFLLGVQDLTDKLDEIIKFPPEGDLLNNSAGIFIDYLNDNEYYFMMMTKFMLEGGLSKQSLQSLNQAMKDFLDKIETIVQIAGGKDNPRYLTHTFFACLNGILISFINYPGRSREELRQHMKILSHLFVQLFKDGVRTGNYNQYIPPSLI